MLQFCNFFHSPQVPPCPALLYFCLPARLLLAARRLPAAACPLACLPAGSGLPDVRTDPALLRTRPPTKHQGLPRTHATPHAAAKPAHDSHA